MPHLNTEAQAFEQRRAEKAQAEAKEVRISRDASGLIDEALALGYEVKALARHTFALVLDNIERYRLGGSSRWWELVRHYDRATIASSVSSQHGFDYAIRALRATAEGAIAAEVQSPWQS